MSQDTRKDPRAKVLTMTVRYKSATLDEFIEHHSYDVSRGGMFIKTPSPFPPGTLLKFEVKIAADQKVIQGVGRVVWKRDSETQGDVRPAGMGVKFIKIDDASRKVIDALVESRGDAASAYEAGGGDSGTLPAPATTTTPAMAPAAASSKTPAVGAEAAKPPNLRKSTMIGLGSMNPSNRPPVSTAPEKPAASFFPETKSEAEMPAPEDRTVMKQAAELLQDALREAGGSLSEVAPTSKPAEQLAKSSPRAAAAPESKRTAEPPPSAPVAASAEPKPEPKQANEKPAAVSIKPAPPKAASTRPPAAGSAARKAGSVSAAPASRRVSVPAAAPAASSGGGGGRVVVIALVLAATGGLVYAFSSGKPPAPAPVVSAEPAPPAAPVATEAPAAPPETASAAAEPAAPPSASAAPLPAASASAAAKPVVPPPVAAPKPAPVQQARPAAKPKPAPVAPSVPAEPAAPPAEKPAAPPPAAAPAPEAPAPKPKPEAPAPKPKPAEPAGDNPY